MEKFISKTTKEFFYDEKGYLVKEVETIEEYKTNEKDSDTTVDNISVKIHVDDGKIKKSSITSDKIDCHSITKKQLNVGDAEEIKTGTIKKSDIEVDPEVKKILDQAKEWNKTTGIPKQPYFPPFTITCGDSNGMDMEGILVLNEASIDELIGSTIKRIQKKMEQDIKKNMW